MDTDQHSSSLAVIADVADLPVLVPQGLAARMAHVSVATIARWRRQGRLRSRRTVQSGSGRVLILRDDLLALLGLTEATR